MKILKGHALSQVSTTIRKGSFIGIVGKPGSGKVLSLNYSLVCNKAPLNLFIWEPRYFRYTFI